MDKQFQAKVTVDPKGKVQGTVIDNSMGEEYLLKLPGVYHGYHMNKENWLCVTLDDSQPDPVIMKLIKKSRAGALVDNVWLIPANPKYYDIMGAFDDQDEITWKQSTDIQVGDTVFMYVTSPVRAIIFRCKVSGPRPAARQKRFVEITEIKHVKSTLVKRTPKCFFS